MREISDAPELENVAGRYQTLRELVARSLRSAILTGAAAPGQMLRERDVARQLGVSKTPVREAFRELERDGLVVSAPHRGVIVAGGASGDAVRDTLELRLALEPFAARLAAERIPDSEVAAVARLTEEIRNARTRDARCRAEAGERLHRKVYELCGNTRLQRVLTDALEHARSATAAGCTGDSALSGHEDHLAVAEAIVRRDPASAERRMRDHMRRVLAGSSIAARGLTPNSAT
jgi:DNA-binding GntR family transcriptional regulator